MGTKRISERNNGIVIDFNWFESIRNALCTDFVPRGTNAEAMTNAGTIGTSLYRFLKAHISEGDLSAGDIKLHHSYNGLVGPGHGWMLCDGRQITEANYNTEHGANTWATYIISSPLLNKYLPNLVNKYLTGANTTTQDGTSTITTIGNASHQINIEHLHQWYKALSSGGNDQSYDSSGSLLNIAGTSTKDAVHSAIYTNTGTANRISADQYTSKTGSTTQSIQPESIELQIYMRII